MFITGNDLRKMRRKAGITTMQMAKLAGVKTRKTYENWEKDIGSPSMNQFLAMAIGCQFNAMKLVALYLERRTLEDEINLSEAHLRN